MTSIPSQDDAINAAADMMVRAAKRPCTVNALTEAMQLPPGAFAKMFPTDETLETAIVNHAMTSLTQCLLTTLDDYSNDDLRTRLHRTATAYLGWVAENPNLYRVIASLLLTPQRTSGIVANCDASFRELFKALLNVDDHSVWPMIMRSCMFGIADMMLDDYLSIWQPTGKAPEESISIAMDEFLSAALQHIDQQNQD
ncbi:TetR/AcrR family transcriptional regulator [Paracoccus sp. (in: a-proteobacteria)]|uniref:TetR/AcrR family transcriptional regulator n=1 Tax=Paracoccus sp. TaxID=267 RepID=UPI0026E043E2|nr:TetR-like C-terminal domain-containing protein [Paracoccus sp. (in: a-proteobacteria)]MDO5648504.1 TetR-like C-terminal domain-containing protein [Paracoccus sp. (in: a-proteobacteria)]